MQNSNLYLTLTNKFADYFSQKDADGISTLLSDNIILEDPELKKVTGKEKVTTILRDVFQKTKDVSYKIINLYHADNTTIVEFKISLDDVVLNGVDFIEWQNAKIKELRCYYNQPTA